jgi:hypothetical protein
VGLMALSEWQVASRTPANSIGTTLTTTGSGWEVFTHAALLPLSNVRPFSTVTFTTVSGAGTYSSVMTIQLNDPFVLTSQLAEHAVSSAAFAFAAPICMALAFAALPISRRIAKVRWSHIIRAAFYSLALVVLPVILVVVDYGLGATTFPAARTFGTLTTLCCLAMFPIQLVFWVVVAGQYLRMSHAWAVGISVVIIGLLTPAAIGGLIYYYQ